MVKQASLSVICIFLLAIVTSTSSARIFEPNPELGSASYSDAQTVDDLVNSSDYQAADAAVLRYYVAFFNRQPDVGGAKYWLDVRRQGFSASQIADFFAQSTEFENAYSGLSNQDYLARVYSNVLGRDFDQMGFTYWLDTLEGTNISGSNPSETVITRAQLVFFVAQSAEFISNHPFLPSTTPPAGSVVFDKVIHISIDGLRPDHITDALAPNLHRLHSQGASTMNARTDYRLTVTLPNHTGQITGRPALGDGSFNVRFNNDNGSTVHSSAGFYVESSFSVAHDGGLETFVLAGKDKFNFLARSWDLNNGAQDATGPDNGTNKIDTYILKGSLEDQTAIMVEQLQSGSASYHLWHIPTPDGSGHADGWATPEYKEAVARVDQAVGAVVSVVEANPSLASSTAIVITADHGGEGTRHDDATKPANYTIPFIVFGDGIAAGDLYAMNPSTRQNPGTERPNESGIQPVRGSEAGNVALQLLGLGPIPGSKFNANHDLNLN